jgi:diazepam-binding inhibitor (GABA receptor modulating acyl-CoA-binding protein)
MFPKRTKSSAVGPPRSNYPANAEHELDHAYVYNTPSNFPTSRLVGSSNYLQHNLKTKFPYQTMTSFQDAVNFANSKRGKGNLTNDQLLQLYAHFKVGSVGRNTTPKPGMLNFKDKAKWDAWTNLSNLPQAQAQAKYVQLVQQWLR